MSNNNKNHLLTTIFVAAVSAGIALLFAPKSGRELRQDIDEKLKEVSEQGRQYAENLAQDIQSAVAEVEAEEAKNTEAIQVVERIEYQADEDE